MIRLRHAFVAIGIVLFFHSLGIWRYYNWYHWYDIPMHIGGGIAMGILALALWNILVKSVVLRTKKKWATFFPKIFFVLGFVGLIGIGWEWFEFLFDTLFSVRLSWGIAQTSVADTMADLFCDLVGGLIGVLAVGFRRV